jgi:hypothetical protein
MTAVPLLAADPLRICIYAGNRGGNKVHRAILKQAKKLRPRFFVADGDLLKYDYHFNGTPEAVLEDYRIVFGTAQHPLTDWPQGPGPALLTVPGGMDEEFFVDPGQAEDADRFRGRRNVFEGTNELGVQLYDAFYLDDMRLRVQSLPEMSKPLPMSPYGDYLLISGSGPRRECAMLGIYRTDRWCFRKDQIDWIDSTLAEFRAISPTLPLIVVASDWTWFLPDTVDDGHIDGQRHSIREGSPKSDAAQKQRLFAVLKKYSTDVAIAAGHHAYWADTTGTLLRVNCGAAICRDPHGQQVAVDNLWLDYSQTSDSMFVSAHSVEPPLGCGINPSASVYGFTFAKRRAAGAVWRTH